MMCIIIITHTCAASQVGSGAWELLQPSFLGDLLDDVRPFLFAADRLMRATGQLLPALVDRAALWRTLQRDRFSRAEVMLTPAGAVKTIGRFKAFATRHGVTQESIIAAYQAARKAATQQQQQGQLPFLVHATTGPKFSREGLEVHTAPLGFHKSISTELVRIAWLGAGPGAYNSCRSFI